MKGYRRTACSSVHHMWSGNFQTTQEALWIHSLLWGSCWLAALSSCSRWWIVGCVGTQTPCCDLHLLNSLMKVMWFAPSTASWFITKPSFSGSIILRPGLSLTLPVVLCLFLHNDQREPVQHWVSGAQCWAIILFGFFLLRQLLCLSIQPSYLGLV